MDTIHHIHAQRVAFTPAHVQLACDGVYLALPLTRTSVGIWSIQNITCKPVELVGHSKILTSLAFGHISAPKLLVSAAEDYVIVWNIQQARQQFEKGEKTRGRVIGTTLGYVQYCSFNPTDSLVAACVGYNIIILNALVERQIAVLEGHNGAVTAAEFCPHYTSTLVSISEDRTFKVWNLEDLTLVYQSPILTASPFLSLSMCVDQPYTAIGAADGVVRIFDLTDDNGFRCLHQIDVGPVTISSRPTWKQQDKNSTCTTDTQDNLDDMVETGYSVLSLYYMSNTQEMTSRQSSAVPRNLPFLREKSGVVSDLLKSSPMLMVGTTAGLLQINAQTMELCSFVDFQEPMKCINNIDSDTQLLNAAGSIIFGQGTGNKMWCIIGSPFQNIVHILEWNVSSKTKPTHTPSRSDISTRSENVRGKRNTSVSDLEAGMARVDVPSRAESSQNCDEITVLSKASLLEDSPLRSELLPKQKDTKETKPKGNTSPRKGGILDNQPLTFKTKVKSSGYSTPPRMTMFQPQTSKSTTKSRTPTRSGVRQVKTAVSREYPMSSNPPVNINMKIEVAERPTAVNCLKVSDGGHNVACALANKSALVFTLPMSNKGSTAYTGHNHIVTGIGWSHCGSKFITSSDDKTASMWIKGRSEPVLTFDRMKKNTASVGAEGNSGFSKEVQNGQFYFMDKFILLCSGNSMFMYKYYLDPSKNEIQRYLTQSRYKLVQQWQMESQQLVAMSAVNSFLSYIVLCGCSNKSIEVYDMNVGQRVRKMTDVHTRPVHALCQNEGSQFVSHQSGAYDLFVSAAAGDCIKLWDLRTNRCIRRYEGHLNRVHPCGVSFSPCGRFLATGSEDKCVYLFDIRSGTYLHKLQGHCDVVSDVSFHPLYPQLFTASLDGRIIMYNNR
ncbi:WD40 repeat-like protein [Mactra antiquata]